MKNNIKYFGFFLVLVVLSFIVFFVYKFYRHGLGYSFANGYEMALTRPDDWRIIKNGQVVVAPTVIDFTKISGYIVGLRMPVQHFECDRGEGYKIKVINEKKFFILSIDDGDVLNFISREKFEIKLKELGLFSDVSLDYSKFDTEWYAYSNGYKRINYSNCQFMEIEGVSMNPAQ